MTKHLLAGITSCISLLGFAGGPTFAQKPATIRAVNRAQTLEWPSVERKLVSAPLVGPDRLSFRGSLNATDVAPASQTDGAMTNADVVKLVQAGLGDALIVQAINQAVSVKFDTSADALVQLKTSHVSDTVIAAMLAPRTTMATSGERAPTSAAPSAVASRTPVRAVKGGVLDEINLYVQKPQSARVVIRPFSATDEDIVKGDKKEETKTMQVNGPRMLAEQFAEKLKKLGPFTDVMVLEAEATVPADAVVVEGKFTELDPGSRAKRYAVGFGSGKSGVTVQGSVKSAEGILLATFEQRRIGVMGAFGGNSLGKLESDTKSIGDDLAKFMSTWAMGKNLK